MPDTRGDVLCPTCGLWTPPAPFCTECGAALQGGFGDPLGGQGADVFRRGHEVDNPGAPWLASSERFEPEPEDQAAVVAATGSGAASALRIDHLAEADTPLPSEPTEPTEPGRPSPPPPPIVPPPVSAAGNDGGDTNGGVTGLVFVFFLGLGILALLGGAILGGVFDSDPVAQTSPTPSAIVSTSTPEPTPDPGTPEPSGAASAFPTPVPTGGEPTTFPDGFLARAEACLEQPTASTCGNSGAVNEGDLWILVSFRNAQPTDVLGVAILDSGGALEGDASLDLGFCGTNTACAGYTYFRFTNLDPGEYDVRANRNGTLAAVTTFTVE